MNFILDSSFALAWVLKDEIKRVETDDALDSWGRGVKAFVPEALLALGSGQRCFYHLWNVANEPAPEEVRAHVLLFQSLPIEVDGGGY